MGREWGHRPRPDEVFTYNLLALERARWEGQETLTPGKHTLEFDFKYDGPGMAKGGTGVLRVDGKEVATKSIPRTVPAILTIDETLDIGSDTRTPVDDADYQVPFRFNGTISKLDFKLGPSPGALGLPLKISWFNASEKGKSTARAIAN
jgi:hypothetical protein